MHSKVWQQSAWALQLARMERRIVSEVKPDKREDIQKMLDGIDAQFKRDLEEFATSIPDVDD